MQTYFQSVYHGTPHRFDEFSLENIGTGEGAQAHGWGLYFAENEEVSENYRKGLTDDILYPDKILVNDTEYIRQENPFGFYDKKGNKIPSIYSRAIGFIRDYGNAQMAIIGCRAKIDNLSKDLERAGGAAAKEIENEIKSLEELKNILEKDKIKEINGQLFKVDIPENDVLLDEDKTFNEQFEKVRDALLKLFNDANIDKNAIKEDIERLEFEIEELKNNDDTDYDYAEFQIEEKEKQLQQLKLQLGIKDIKKHNYSGKGIYRTLCDIYGSDKAASEKLNEYGIKGIAYDGRQDGRCYVIFDDKAINVLKTYYQGENINGDLRSDIENARGFTYQRFNFDGTVKDNLITLLNNKADKSTLIHEFAHVYLTTLTNMARENERAKSMLLTVNKWLRYDGIEYTTAQHEKFANGFVAYVRSGKAPTYGLKLAFENFRKWLNDLYNTITNNDDLFLDQETEKVFEELLGDISINAQKKAANDIIDRAKRYAEIRFNDEGLKNKIDQNKLTDTQRRYRDTAYDIMYYALSHSKKANSNPGHPRR